MFTLPVLADIACGHQHPRIVVAIVTKSFVRMLQDIPNKAEFEEEITVQIFADVKSYHP
jgi:hypothetical protein